MSTDDHDLQEAHYRRFLDARATVVSRLRKLADEIEEVPENDHRGKRREPTAIIGQITHMLLWGAANLGLDRMASWADSIYEIRSYNNEEAIKAARPAPFAKQCTHSIEDPHRTCVLDANHTLPYNGGLVHMSADGVEFV